MKLTDENIMPFGKYSRSETKMQDVPAGYLHWLWHNGKREEPDCPVHQYIKDNWSILENETPDLIWEL